MAIFKVENELLVLDKEEIRGCPEFRSILERDKGTKGDNDGRKKARAWKEFYYIYVVADYFSFANQSGYNEVELHNAGIKEAQLEADFKPDKDIKAAIVKYREVQEATLPSLTAISVAIRALRMSSTIYKGIINNIETTIEKHDKIRKEKEERNEPIDIASDLAMTENMSKQLDTLINSSTKLPKLIQNLNELYESLRREQNGSNVARGGHKIGNRANPKNN